MNEETKKIMELIYQHCTMVGTDLSEVRHYDLAEEISSNYINKDKVMEITSKVWLASIRKQTDQQGELGYTAVMEIIKKEYGL